MANNYHLYTDWSVIVVVMMMVMMVVMVMVMESRMRLGMDSSSASLSTPRHTVTETHAMTHARIFFPSQVLTAKNVGPTLADLLTNDNRMMVRSLLGRLVRAEPASSYSFETWATETPYE